MVKIYLRKIRAGEMVVSQVPQRWRGEVEMLLGRSGD